MDRHDAVYGRSDTEAAADLPTNDAGPNEQLRPAAQHPALLLFTAATGGGPTVHRTGLPSSLRAVDAAGPTTAARLPRDVPAVDGTGRSPTAGFPAGGPAVVDRLHGPLQTP